MSTCNHILIDTEDGSGDKFCLICADKAKQAVMSLPLTPQLTAPIMRETVTINMGHLGKAIVYKDELQDQIKKHFMINSTFLSLK